MKLCCYGKIGSNFKIKRTHQKLGTTDKDAIKKTDAGSCVAVIQT